MKLHIAKDRGRLELAFDVDGARVWAWMPVHKTKAVLSLSPGDPVELLFDAGRPRRAVVRKLFES